MVGGAVARPAANSEPCVKVSPLRGKPVRYVDPFESIAEYNWDALKGLFSTRTSGSGGCTEMSGSPGHRQKLSIRIIGQASLVERSDVYPYSTTVPAI